MAHSLKKRYAAKLGANVFILVINLVIQAIVPRALGPKAYGDFNFVTNFFTQVISFFDVGTSTCFYTELSRRQHDFRLVSFYFRFMLLVGALTVVLVPAIELSGFSGLLLPGQETPYVYMAALWALLLWVTQILTKMSDAYGLTVSSETAKILQRVLALLIILPLFLSDLLGLTTFYLYQYLILLLLVALFLVVFKRGGINSRASWRLSRSRVRHFVRLFYNYSHPLLVYAAVGLVSGIFDRWMLQYFSGSQEQGYFSLAYRVGLVCIMMTASMSPLLTRELAIAHGKRNLAEMARLYSRYVPMLYAATAYLACFLCFQAREVALIMGGGQFEQATLVLAVMSLYPMHQTYGQLNGSLFYAVGLTPLYRNIGVLVMLAGVPMTFFLLGPARLSGLGLGAAGLAVKMVALQLVAVNVQLFFCARYLRIKFTPLVGQQLICAGTLLAASFLSRYVVRELIPQGDNLIWSFLAAGVIYTLLTAGILWWQPRILGLTRADLSGLIKLLRSRLGPQP